MGCKIGADLEFVETLAQLTQADIAASNDLTGNKDNGGDWQLEINLGEIESQLNLDLRTLQNYQSILEISPSELILELDFNDPTGNIASNSAIDSTIDNDSK